MSAPGYFILRPQQGIFSSQELTDDSKLLAVGSHEYIFSIILRLYPNAQWREVIGQMGRSIDVELTDNGNCVRVSYEFERLYSGLLDIKWISVDNIGYTDIKNTVIQIAKALEGVVLDMNSVEFIN